MAHSLRCKLSKLRYKGKITEEEYKELINKLDGHDEVLKKLYERPNGRWVLSTQGQYFCSQCKLRIGGYERSSFCPSCGADMRNKEKAINQYKEAVKVNEALKGLQDCIDSLSTPQGQYFLELLDEISESQIYEGTMDR